MVYFGLLFASELTAQLHHLETKIGEPQRSGAGACNVQGTAEGLGLFRWKATSGVSYSNDRLNPYVGGFALYEKQRKLQVKFSVHLRRNFFLL